MKDGVFRTDVVELQREYLEMSGQRLAVLQSPCTQEPEQLKMSTTAVKSMPSGLFMLADGVSKFKTVD